MYLKLILNFLLFILAALKSESLFC